MGVMECDRNGCDNIMCSKYSNNYGYICDECFEEMKGSDLSIETFMAKRKVVLESYDYEKEFGLSQKSEVKEE